MIKLLKKRITIIFSVLSILVLTMVVVVSFFSTFRQIDDAALQLFTSHINGLTDKIMYSGMIRQEQISGLIQNNNIYIYIEDNSRLLHFSEKYSESLIEEVKEKHVNLSSPDASGKTSADFFISVNTKNDTRVKIQQLYINKKWLGIISFQPREEEQEKTKRLIIQSLFLELLAALTMVIISRFLAGIAVKPTEESVKMQKEFVAAASHEIRSPLAVIKASFYAIKVRPEQREHFTRVIDNEIDNLARLTNDLFLLSESDRISWTLLQTNVDIGTLCLSLHESYKAFVNQNKKYLEINLPDYDLPTVFIDKDRITQMLTILINNSMHHTKDGTKIIIGAAVEDRSLLIYIEDNGEGIPKDLEKKIFQRFYRGEKSRTKKSRLGLGLSIAKEIAELHGGELIYKTIKPRGSRFTFKLRL